MRRTTSLTKAQLLRVITDLERNPKDRLRILGEIGISTFGVGVGAAAAGTAAAIAGATSIFGLTTAGSWLGISIVAATPVGWIIGCAAAGGAAAYGISRFIRNGALSESKKSELLRIYQSDLAHILDSEQAGTVTDMDRTKFICSLRILVEKNTISPDSAFRLIQQVEQGSISVSKGIELIQGILRTTSEELHSL